MNENIYNTTQYLFDCDFFADSFDPEDHEEHLDKAYALMKEYSWQEIFPVWNSFLHEHCQTAAQVINFVNLFMYYGATDEYIPNPYDFVGYILCKVDLDKYWDVAGDTIDSLANAVLQKAGCIDLMKDPYYQAWKDPHVIAVIDKYKLQDH